MRAWLVVVLGAVTLSACVVVTERRSPSGEGAGPEGSGGSAGQYSFLHTRGSGKPVRWSTCEPIRYVVRRINQPEGAQRLLRESISRISEVTGIEWASQGTTREAPTGKRRLYQPRRYGQDQWAPVLIAYSAPEEYSRLRGQAAGYGGAAYVRQGNAPPRYVSGMAVFDAEQMTAMGGRQAMRAVMLHELAHVTGLGHVNNRNQLMNPVQYGRQVSHLQQGDIAGLRRLGNGACYEPLAPRSIR
ncbi:MAG TPA: matrixin family metalloprotease [Nocardioidaceae bacterium]|nr:matrixin family metalloprotease [Nocardioidaceae bacterium]